MSAKSTFAGRLFKVIVPTRVQVLVSIFLSLSVLIAIESTTILHRFSISDVAVQGSRDQLQNRFSDVSNSLLASNIALVAFWSVVGLLAYLICWAGYNFLVEARNEVTLETQYENLGRHGGIIQTIAVKAVSCLGLVLTILMFRYALALAVALVSPVIADVIVGNILAAIAGVLALAIAIYLIIMFITLTFSAWYRPEAFTD
ncbi:hypothetical protein HJC99_04020 [Candidatus Saccharibacteria bacterium]|nr:hypothetical protein [Candidatus Saccharibacteria bacterium]